jgi:sensor domain CHASE-containing protein
MLRLMQRTLRDHFTTIAEELQNSINGAVQSAQAALKESETERNSSIQNLEAELKRVAGLAQQARALAPAQPVGAGV